MAFRSLLLRVLLILTLVLDGTAVADCHERHGQRVPLASAVAAHGAHTAHRRWPAGSTTTTGTARTTASEASPLCLDFPPQETTS